MQGTRESSVAGMEGGENGRALGRAGGRDTRKKSWWWRENSFLNPGVLGPWNEEAGDHDSCSPSTSGVNRICTGLEKGANGF